MPPAGFCRTAYQRFAPLTQCSFQSLNPFPLVVQASAYVAQVYDAVLAYAHALTRLHEAGTIDTVSELSLDIVQLLLFNLTGVRLRRIFCRKAQQLIDPAEVAKHNVQLWSDTDVIPLDVFVKKCSIDNFIFGNPPSAYYFVRIACLCSNIM